MAEYFSEQQQKTQAWSQKKKKEKEKGIHPTAFELDLTQAHG